MTQLGFEGDAQLHRLAVALVESATSLPHTVTETLRGGARPIGPASIREGAQRLPASGGLRTRVSAYGADVTVSGEVVTIALHGIAGYDTGRVTHPVFGDRAQAITQAVPTARAFTTALERRSRELVPAVAHEMQHLLDNVARKV